jgi:hypothetical protein
VQALGAHWDAQTKCWYINSIEEPARLAKWLPDEAAAEEEFTITSSHAYVASTIVSCEECHSKIEVICIHCESGTAAAQAPR